MVVALQHNRTRAVTTGKGAGEGEGGEGLSWLRWRLILGAKLSTWFGCLSS